MEQVETKVDVLAVMDRAAARAALLPELAADLTNARAAIAELIEAVKAVKQWDDVSGLDDEWPLVMEVVDAALARVGGSK